RDAGVDFRTEAAATVSRLLAPLEGRFLSWRDAESHLSSLACGSRELPFLCAVETALLDLACAWGADDVFTVLGREPRRPAVRYGGVLPLLSLKEAEKYLLSCRHLELCDIKVNLNSDTEVDQAVLDLSRRILGDRFDIRVDANSSWPVDDAEKLFDVCRRYGVTSVEQPFDDLTPGASECMREARARGFVIMADEGVLSAQDIRNLAGAGTYSSVNLRLAKNGGLTRVIQLCEEAGRCGLSYQLGCMVGETGILSALGRVAAAILPAPLYVEGSYDDMLLTGNITTRSMGFGPKGFAPVTRGDGIGYQVSEEKLARFSAARASCL
ncbi:MAG TPA: enolase C-terminal domain-like protein, partial [Spirochaetia bacterium]|nr:enolase C-terminal domain-like protein [Spirochaetia bacterium]